MVRCGWNSNGFASHRLEEALPLLADLGFEAVAITPDVPHLDPRYATPAEVERIGQLCQQLGLLPVLETGARYLLDSKRKHRPNMLELDDSKDIRLKFLRHMIEWCELLGAETLSFWSGVLPEGQTEAGAMDRLAVGCENLAGVAARRGVRLALEPEPGHFIATLEDWRAFHSAHPGLVGLTLDVGHLLANEEPPAHEAIPAMAEHILNIQLDDSYLGVHEHLAPGEGDVDFPALQEAIVVAGLDCPACWELPRDGHRFASLAPEVARFWQGLEK